MSSLTNITLHNGNATLRTGYSYTVVLTFDTRVGGVTAANVVVPPGTILTKPTAASPDSNGRSTTWLFELLPPANTERTNNTLGMSLTGVTDQNGAVPTNNTAPVTYAVDTIKPTLQSAKVTGNQLVLTYSENLDTTAANAPRADRFVVTADDKSVLANGTTINVTGSPVVNGRTVTLTLASAVASGQQVKVSYADSAPGDDTRAIQDAAGNDAASFRNQVATNETPPVIHGATVNGTQLVLSYTTLSGLDAVHPPPASAFAVTSTGITPIGVSSVSVDAVNNTVTLTLSRPVANGETVSVNYTRPATGDNVIQDAAGNDAANIQNRAVTNETPPVCTSATVTGNQLVLRYDTDNLDETVTGRPPSSAFEVLIDGATRASVQVVTVNSANKTVTLTLDRTVTPGQKVTVAYTDPTNGNDPRAVQDAAGNDAASFNARPVTNDATAPVLAEATVDRNQLVLRYTENDRLDAINAAPATAFTVTAGGLPVTVSSVLVDAAAKTVTLTLASNVAANQAVTVAYRAPATGNNAIQDAAGNDAANFDARTVDNITTRLVCTKAEVDGNKLTLSFPQGTVLNNSVPGIATFALNSSGGLSVSSVAVDTTNNTIVLTLNRAVAHGEAVTITYNDPAGDDTTGVIQSSTGADLPTFSREVTNRTGPTMDDVKVDGDKVTITYLTNSLDAFNQVAATAFGVRTVGTTPETIVVKDIQVDAATKTITLTLERPVTRTETVTVSYTDPTSGNDSNAVQDTIGNDAKSVSMQAINVTPHASTLDSIAINDPNLKAGETAIVTLTFSAAVDGLTVANLGLPAGTAVSNVRAVNGATGSDGRLRSTTWQFELTPPANTESADNRINVNLSGVKDANGNAVTNNAPAVAYTVDTRAPIFVSATVNGDQLELVYSEALDGTNKPEIGRFAVSIDGRDQANGGVRAVAVDGRKVTLTLTTPVTSGQQVKVTYNDPSSSTIPYNDTADDTLAIQDAAGNDAITLTTQSVTNTTPPTFRSATVNGDKLVLRFDTQSDLNGVNPAPATAFDVTNASGTSIRVLSVSVDAAAKTVTLTLERSVPRSETVFVAYRDPTPGNDTDAVQDAAGNDVADIARQPVANEAPAPTVTYRSSTVDGNQLVVYFSASTDLDLTAITGNPGFTVIGANNSPIAVSSVRVNADKSVTLTLARAVVRGEQVTISYTDPRPSADDAAGTVIQDRNGTDATSFEVQTVNNNTPELPSVTVRDATVNGNQLVVAFNASNDLDLTALTGNPGFSVASTTAGSAAITVSSVRVNADKTVTLTLSRAVANGETVTVSYTDPAGDGAGDGASGTVIQDSAGTDASSFQNQAVTNNTPVIPPVTVRGATVNGNQLVVAFNASNDLDLTALTGNPGFSVTGANNSPITVSSVRVNADKTVTLTLSRAVANGETVTVSYTDAAGDGASGTVIQDSAGTDASSFQNQAVTNNTPVTPSVTVRGATVNGNQLVVAFNASNDLDLTALTGNPGFSVASTTAGSAAITVSSVRVNADKTVTLTLSRAVTNGETVTVSYTDAAGDGASGTVIQDSAGTDASSFQNQAVTNNTPVPAPVTVRGATVNGNQLVVAFNASNDLDLTALTGNPGFSVTSTTAGSAAITVSSVRVNADKTVTLTLSRAVAHGETVTVSYTDAAGDGASGTVIQDSAGTDASSFQNQAVTNNTPVPAPVTVRGATVNGNQLVVAFNASNDLDLTALTGNPGFSVTGANNSPITVSSVRVNADKTVTLTLSRAVANGETVTVSYTDAAGDGASGTVIQDSAGTDASSFQNQAVTNNTPVPAPVTVRGATVNGNQLVVAFNASNDLDLTALTGNPGFSVTSTTAGSAAITVSSVRVNADKTVTLTLSRAVANGETVTVSYTDAAGDGASGTVIQDSAGTDASSFQNQAVTNNTPVPAPVTVRGATVNGNQLVVTFTASNDLDLAAITGNPGFAVTGANNSPITVSSVRVNADKTVTLTLARAVTNGETVKVSYTDPAGDGASGTAIQDSAGTDASSFQNQAVTNDTPPVCTGATVSGNQLVLRFDLAGSLVTTGVPNSAFELVVGSGSQPLSVTAIGAFNATDKTLTLTLNRAVIPGETVSIRYTDPNPDSNEGSGALEDSASRDVPTFVKEVTNNTPATPPAFSKAEVNGNQLVVTFTASNDLDLAAITGNPGFSVTGANNSPITVSSVRVNADKTVTLTLSRAVANGETVKVSYTDPAGDGASGTTIQDSAGTDASSFQNQAVTNDTPPVCTGATVSGNQLVLRFDLAGSLVTTGVPNSAFELVVGSGSQPLSVTAIGAFNATDKTLTLTLNRAVIPGETVSIRYTDPNPDSNEGSGALEDSASRDVPTFAKEVINNTPATPPAFSRAEVNGNQLVVTFTASNDLDLAAITGNPGFAVTGANNSPITVSSVRVNADKTVTLTLARAVANGETVKVSYTDAAGDGASGTAIQDSAGTDASSFQNQTVTNDTPPVCTSATVDGNQLVLHFPNVGSLSKAGVPITAFVLSVDAGGQALSVTAIGDFNATSKTLTLTLNRAVANGETVRIRYTDPTPGNDGNVLQDATTDGRDVPSFDMAATNDTPATPPAFSRAEVNGNQLVVTFTATDGLDTTALPPGNAGFTVASTTAGSAAITVNSVRVNADKTVTLTLSRAVTHGETVTVSYADPNPTVNDDTGVIQDTTPAHTDASSFQNQAVTNGTPPVCTGATVSGNQLVLRFDLAGSLVTTGVPNSAFELIVGSGSQPLSVTAIGAFNATDKTLTLTLNRAVANGETVSIRYTDPNPDSNAGSGALEDSASRDVPSFEKNVVNNTAAPPPVLTSASANGRELVLQYSAERNLDGQNKAAAADFTVTVNGVANAVTEVVVHPQNKTVTLKLTTPVPAGAVVEVTYNKQATGNNVIQDAGGTDAASFTTSPTVNTGADETPPTIDRAEVTGNSRNQLLLRYDEANLLHANSGAGNDAFTVTVNGQTNAVTGVTVDRAARTVTLALTSAVAAGAQVTVQYTQPTTGSSIKDAYGNPAPTQTLTAVDSGSDVTPPLLITDLTDAARRPQVTGNGTQVTLTYTEANLLDEANKPLPSAFSVTVNGDPRTVTHVTVDRTAKTVTLTLSGAAVPEGARVRLTYTDPTAGDDTAAIQDARGNDAVSTTTPIEVYNGTDNTPPLLITAGADRPKVSGRELTLTYSDVNLLDTADKPAPGAFTVTVNGRNNVVTAVNVHATNKTVTLTLTDRVPEGAVVRLSYADPTTGNDTAAIQDVGGNDAASITNLSVDSGEDSTPPMLIASGPGAPTVTGATRTQLTLTYTEDNLMDGSATGLKDAYTVLVNGERAEIVSHTVNSTDKTVTLTLRDPVPVGAQVRLTYTDPSTGANDTSAIQDAAGNDAPSTNSPVVVASGTDSTAPVLITSGAGAPEVTGDARNQLTLTYTEANLLDDEHKPVPGAFAVTVNRANNQVTAVSVNATNKTVTLTLTDPVPRGAEMTVAYTRPATGDVLQDKAGNPAASTPATTVNSGEDTAPPQLQQIASPSLNTTPKVVDDKLTLHYTDTNLLDDRDGSKPLATAFRVMVSGTQVEVRNVAVNATDKTVTLTLDRAVARGEVVTVAYTDPTTGNDTRAIQDAKGNDAASTGPLPVDSGVDNTAPVLVTTGTHRPKIPDNARNQLVLTYTDANNLHEFNKAPGSAFEVIVNGASNEVTNVSVVGLNKTVTLTLRDPVPLGASVTVRYTKPDGTTTVIQDEAGNDALSTNSPVDVASGQDQTAPQLITTGDDAPRIDGNRLTLSYREDNLLDNRDGHKPGGTAFTVLVNGERNVVTGVEVSPTNKTVTLILTRAVTGGETVTVAYTAPTDGNDPRDIQDAAGNDAASIPQTNVRNAPDSTAPVLITEGDNRPIITGEARTQLTLTYTEANTLDPANKAAPGAFTVLVNGVRTEVTEVTVGAAGKTVILTLRTPVPEGAQVTVTYTKPASDTINAIQDRTGNDAASTTSPVAVRSGTDRTAPVLITAGDNAPRVRGRELTLTFAEDNLLDAANKPEISAFSVSSNGADIGVLDVSVNAQDRTVTLTLARAVSSSDRVSVRYTDRTAGNDTDAIQDATGNDVSDFTVTSVANRTPDPVTPTTPTTPTTNQPDGDRDGVSNAQEESAHGLARPDGTAVAGDGNGDGIKDSEQPAVSSINDMTLVAGSQDGKVKPGNQTQISNVLHTREAPADLPRGLEMPMGTLHFDATIPTAGGSESFSLYVDPARGINGYWVKDQAGVWVNLASAPYGGQMVMEGDRLRLDFQITDGGQFDADGQANGVIAIPGAAAQMQLSVVGQSPTAELHGFWF
ncbi:SwmB domain-containing protein [Verminephrobacter eiseniae]|uniref:SwmB domain-containing protein n=1 Tax=Verminephrobacter eiseniae TaxID=364317 RepID=UPI0022372294|nr:SwmB domain-containing protein [Verminephrobacter eiseniae]MCW5239043.1 hypothetical protein [Verminephrobacter eiseniae]